MNVFRLLFKTVMPGSLAFLLGGLCVGLMLLYSPRWMRLGRRILATLVVTYWFISTQLGSGLLTAGLSRQYTSIENVDQAKGANAVVVLTGGVETFRDKDRTLHALSPSTAVRSFEA